MGWLISFINNYICFHLRNVKPYVEHNCNYLIEENKDDLDVFCEFYILFNILMVVLSVIKILVGKLFNEKSK